MIMISTSSFARVTTPLLLLLLLLLDHAGQCLAYGRGRSRMSVRRLAEKSGGPSLTVTMTDANIAFNTLQQWYNVPEGVYDGGAWWNTANSELNTA